MVSHGMRRISARKQAQDDQKRSEMMEMNDYAQTKNITSHKKVNMAYRSYLDSVGK